MRAALINTGTELLLGDVQDAHLAFIAREIFPLGLRILERRTVPDTEAIGRTLTELFPHCEILFVTGGLGPTTDDITREMVAESLRLQPRQDPQLLAWLQQRLQVRGIKWTSGIARQAEVLAGAHVLPNENGSASGFYLKANINRHIPSPYVFVLPGPPRELQPMFRKFAIPILHSIVTAPLAVEGRSDIMAGMAESCTGGFIATCITNVPGVSEVFLAGYVTYANNAKSDVLNVDPKLIEKHGAVSDPVARAMAEGARARSFDIRCRNHWNCGTER